VAAYLDNSWEENREHLEDSLRRILETGLTLNVMKCELARQETSYLGYHLDNGKLRPQVDKVEAIWRSPTLLKRRCALAWSYKTLISPSDSWSM